MLVGCPPFSEPKELKMQNISVIPDAALGF
jgi:hypothetical protein